MGARALGVGALFVNVLLILARDGSRSNLPPPHPHPRLLLLPSSVSSGKAGSADTQLPRQRPRCAFRGAGLPAAFYVFFLKGGSDSTHFARVWHAIVPALREYRMRRKSSSSTLALSLELGAPGAKQGPPGTGEEFVHVHRGR